MAKAILIVAAVTDFAIAVLLIAVSGFLFGGGPQSMNAGPLAAVVYTAIVIGCLAVPVLGFIFNARGKTGLGIAIALLPPAGGLIALMIPSPY